MARISIDKPVNTWSQNLKSIDIQQHVDRTFGAIVCLILTLIFPAKVINYAIPSLAKQFVAGDDNIDFILKIYLPELNKVTANVHITFMQKLYLIEKFIGMIIKILYAFMW